MDGIQATPTTTVTGLFSTIAGDITADTVNSVISDLNLFREYGIRECYELYQYDYS